MGKYDFRKQFPLALKALSRISDNYKFRLTVIAPFTNERQRENIEDLVRSSGLDGIVDLKGKVDHKEVLDLMTKSDILLFTSIMEGTPHVVLEAIGNNLPVICFDTCGQGDVVNDKIGIKISLTDIENSSLQFAEAITSILYDRNQLKIMKANCHDRQSELSWRSKVRKVVDIYDSFEK